MQIKKSSVGGMDIFCNHTLYISCYTSLEESDNDDLNDNLSELSTNSADEKVDTNLNLIQQLNSLLKKFIQAIYLEPTCFIV